MKKTVAIIGGGPAAMTCAAFLNKDLFKVTIYEKTKTLGKKFLVAGKGGFNLTHSEPMLSFLDRYQANDTLKESLTKFDNDGLRKWLKSVGIATYVGSSKRVYPKEGIKPIEVLNKLKKVLENQHVQIKYNKEWKGWNDTKKLTFTDDCMVDADIIIFALGGASWKVTGSSGDWLRLFDAKTVKTVPFYPSNCAYKVNWLGSFIDKNEGKPLKNIAITCGKSTQKGEAVMTRFGLEGNAIYGLSPEIRKQLKLTATANISIDLKPMLSVGEVCKKLSNSRFSKITDKLKKELKISGPAIDLIKSLVSKQDFLDVNTLSKHIKQLDIMLIGHAHLDDAISTAGGISLDAIDNNYQLKKLPNHYCLGEMLDWDAPTGGYLLQACFSMGYDLSHKLNLTAS